MLDSIFDATLAAVCAITKSAKLGAKFVYGTDIDELRIERANFIKEIKTVDNVKFENISLYDSPTDKKYDIALGLGLLHRVPDIEKCLEHPGQVANTLVLEFKMFKDERNMCYVPKVENDKGRGPQSRSANFFYGTPTESFVRSRLEKLGFTKNSFVYDEESSLKYPRTILVSSKE